MPNEKEDNKVIVLESHAKFFENVVGRYFDKEKLMIYFDFNNTEDLKFLLGEDIFENFCRIVNSLFGEDNEINRNKEIYEKILSDRDFIKEPQRIPELTTNQLLYDYSIRFGPLILLTVAVSILGGLNRYYLRLAQNLESQAVAILLHKDGRADNFVAIYSALSVDIDKPVGSRKVFSLAELIKAARGERT